MVKRSCTFSLGFTTAGTHSTRRSYSPVVLGTSGTSAIPHLGQSPAAPVRTSGHIGQAKASANGPVSLLAGVCSVIGRAHLGHGPGVDDCTSGCKLQP